MKTDIEIAQEAKLQPILQIAQKAGLKEEEIEYYGKYKAKVDLSVLEKNKKEGKLILVTAINPTPAGEGKTTTTIGLADGLSRLKHNVVVALREPSLGPVFGVKGGAAGADMRKSFPWKISTCTLRAISTRSARRTICLRQCSITTFFKETS